MKEDIYLKYLGLKDFNEIVDKFHETIIDTNRSHNFFVNWEKIESKVKKHKIEFNILNTLIGSKDFDNDLQNLLSKYPEIIPVIPILIAVRDLKLKVIKDFYDSSADIIVYNFEKRKLSSIEIENFVDFFEKTGLKYFFENLSTKSIQDYITGVEVGMDTHARKNRSGVAMELAIKPFIIETKAKNDKCYEILFQKKFNYLKKKFDVDISSSIANRKADFIILKNNHSKIINIEVNFYSGTGSKPQEIVDAYINRQNELKDNNIEFIWITDGFGWKGQKNQIKKGFEEINFILNLHFVRKKVLEGILWEI